MRKLIYIVSIVILSAAKNLPCVAQSPKIDSLQSLLQKNLADTTRINTLNALAWQLKHQNPDTSILLSQKALALCARISPSEKKVSGSVSFRDYATANSRHNLGEFNWRKGDYSQALAHFHKALEIWKQLYPPLGGHRGASTAGNIGAVYYSQGDYPGALEYYFKALRINKELENKSHIAVWLGNIGIVYYGLGDYPKALEHYFKALKISEELGNKSHIAAWLGNIGVVYHKQAESALGGRSPGSAGAGSDSLYSKTLEYYFKALRMDEELGSKSQISGWLANIGVVYFEQGSMYRQKCNCTDDGGNYLKALEYYFKALKTLEELGDKSKIAAVLGNIGSLYIKLDRYEEAETYLLRTLVISDSIGALDLQKEHHEYLSDLYAKTGSYEKAYEHYKKYSAAKDSLFNEEKSKDIGKLEAKHEFEMAETERKRIEEEQAKQVAAAKSRRDNLQYSGIVIGLLVIGLLVVLLARFNMPVRMVEGAVFISFLIFFEFLLVLLDPYIEQYSAGAPAVKLAFNAALAGCIFPLHSFFERKMKRRLAR